MTQEEAAAILAMQRYTFVDEGETITLVGLDALVEYTRKRTNLPTDDMRNALVPLAEFTRLGALEMPSDPKLRQAVQGIIAFTAAAAVEVGSR